MDSQIKAAIHTGNTTANECYEQTVLSRGPALAVTTLACSWLSFSQPPHLRNSLGLLELQEDRNKTEHGGRGEINRKDWGRGEIALGTSGKRKERGQYWHEKENTRQKQLNSWYEGKQRSRKLPEC